MKISCDSQTSNLHHFSFLTFALMLNLQSWLMWLGSPPRTSQLRMERLSKIEIDTAGLKRFCKKGYTGFKTTYIVRIVLRTVAWELLFVSWQLVICHQPPGMIHLIFKPLYKSYQITIVIATSKIAKVEELI